MHIAIADAQLGWGGQPTYVQRVAQSMHQRGHQISVLCKPDSQLAEFAQQQHLPHCTDLSFTGGVRIGPRSRDIAAARRFIARHKPDVIHVNGSQDHWALALANRSLGQPARVIRTRHNTKAVKNSHLNRRLNQQWTDQHLAVCDAIRCDYAHHPVFAGQTVQVLHNCVDDALWQPRPAAKQDARQLFAYQTDDIVIAIVGKLAKRKGHAVLLQALAQLPLPRIKLLIIGQGPLESSLRTQAQQLGLARDVTFAGYRNDIQHCLQAADVCCLPSIAVEASPFALLEQMACGLPVVVSNQGGMPEIVEDGRQGFVVPAQNIPALATALGKLAANPGLRQHMGAAARRRISHHFNQKQWAAALNQLYTAL